METTETFPTTILGQMTLDDLMMDMETIRKENEAKRRRYADEVSTSEALIKRHREEYMGYRRPPLIH